MLDQRLAAGIGNKWKAEGLHRTRLSPWLRLRDVDDESLRRVLEKTAEAMQRGKPRTVYRGAGRPCPGCGTKVESWPQGDDARLAYWCPNCQPGPGPAGRR
jgi:endonuclease-8